MDTKEMLQAKAKPGYWFVNVAEIGEKPNWQEQAMPLDQTGKLFGYDEKEFLAKQYRKGNRP